MLKAGLLLTATLAACAPAPEPAGPLSVAREPVPGGTRLLLVAEPGARISAGYAPTLTLGDGTVVRFDTSAVTADSAYFAAPPAATLDRPPDAAHGRLKASVCPRNEAVCQLIKMDV